MTLGRLQTAVSSTVRSGDIPELAHSGLRRLAVCDRMQIFKSMMLAKACDMIEPASAGVIRFDYREGET